jgi:hypothetical protein
MINQQESLKNIKKCSNYNSCSQNLCPLDLELNLRYGGKQDKCRFMREPKRARIAGREFVSGGVAMPDAPLKFVPEGNLKWCNEASKRRWQEIDQ